jgi:AcrR family transcriptional regulator
VSRRTRLSVALSDEAYQAKATPVDVFKLARQWWFEGRRLNLGALADEIGVSRATVFRWVGNKDLLLAEILWSMYAPVFEHALAESQGSGLDRLVDFYRRIAEVCVHFKPLQQFLRQDPEYALRVLTTEATPYHERMVAAWKSMLEEHAEQGVIQPDVDIDTLAEMIVRINEGGLYGDLIAGRKVHIEGACLAFRLLLTGKAS